MLFSMLTAAAAMQGFALRPQHSNSATIARLAESLSTADRATFLQDASSVVDKILLQTGNATEHLEAADVDLLEKVIGLIEKDMYGSMDDSHDGDGQDLKDAIDAILACNADITARQSATGDLGVLHQGAIDLQHELDRLQGVVNDKRGVNDTIWGQFDEHMQVMQDGEPCPDFPSPRGMALLDIYFEKSLYSIWWLRTGTDYKVIRDRWIAADKALREAISAFNIHKATFDVKYCDYKSELEAACARFDECYERTVDHYTNTLVPRVKRDMNQRIEIFKAGQTLLAQVRFLLAHAKTSDVPEFSTDRFELTFPAVPAKDVCDESTLKSADWSHIPNCKVCEQGFGIGHTFGVKSWLINDECANAFTVQRGVPVNVHIEYESWEHGCAECIEQMYVGIRGQKLDCIYTGNPSGHLHDDHTLTLQDLEPGTYQIVATATWMWGCQEKTDGRWIATIHVQ